jgi:RNA polymerase sigma factor (sigma-70 family)
VEFKEFFNTYHEQIRAFCPRYSKTLHRYDINVTEALHEVLLGLWERINQEFKGDPREVISNLEYYLKKEMRRVIFAKKVYWWRFYKSLYQDLVVHSRKQWEQETFYDTKTLFEVAGDPMFLDDVINKTGLTALQKKIFKLKHEGYNQEEIATKLKLHQPRISAELKDMKVKIKEYLKP